MQHKNLLLQFVTLFVLCSFAITQPVLEVLANNPTFLLTAKSEAQEIYLFLLILTITPALLLALPLTFVYLVSRKLERVFAHGINFFLCSLLVLPLLVNNTEVSGHIQILLSLLIGAGLCWFFVSNQIGRTLLVVVTPAIFVFPLIFITQNDIQKIINTQESQQFQSNVETHNPIILIVFDELPLSSLLAPSGNIDKSRFPAFSDLAGTSHWFRNTYTLSEDTETSLPVILSGTLPDAKKISSYQDHPDNIFTLFGRQTPMNVYESITQLCPNDLCRSKSLPLIEAVKSFSMDVVAIYLNITLPDDLDLAIPDISQSWSNFWTQGEEEDGKTLHKYLDRPIIFDQFVASIDNESNNQLNVLHILLPHVPMYYLPSGKSYTFKNVLLGMVKEKWGDNEFLVNQAYQRHLLQLQYTDKLLGDVFQKLRTLNIYNESLIIVTADHGVGFWPGESRRSVRQAHPEDIIRVPFFVKEPGQKNKETHLKIVQTIDILPTIIDILDIDNDWKMDGNSVFNDSAAITFAHIATRTGMVKIDPVPDIQATMNRKNRLFGTNQKQLFGIGDLGHMVGKSISDFPSDIRAENSFELESKNLYGNINLDSTFSPSLVNGRIFNDTTSKGEDRSIAISVNGIIQGITESITNQETEQFSSLVAESSFIQGENRIQLFRISDGPDNNTTLQEIPEINSMEYELHTNWNSSGEAKIISSAGEEFLTTKKDLRGYLDGARLKDNMVKLVGWAADIINPESHMSIVVFKNNKSIAIRETGVKRVGVARVFKNQKLLRSGFAFHVSAELLGKGNDIRVFVLSNKGVSRELIYFKGYDL